MMYSLLHSLWLNTICVIDIDAASIVYTLCSLLIFFGFYCICLQPPDKPKLVWNARKLDLVGLARLAGLKAVRYKIVGIQIRKTRYINTRMT